MKLKFASFLLGVILANHAFGSTAEGKAIFKSLVFNQEMPSSNKTAIRLNAKITKLFSETYRKVIDQSQGKVTAEDVNRALKDISNIYANKIDQKHPEFFKTFAEKITSGDPELVDLSIRELVDILDDVASDRNELVASDFKSSRQLKSSRALKPYPDELAVVLMHVVEAVVAYDLAVAVDVYVAVNTNYWTSSTSLSDLNSLERDTLIMDITEAYRR